MIRKILVPLDLTSADAARFGISLAHLFRAEIIFVHCLPFHAVTSKFFFPNARRDGEPREVSPEEKRRAEEKISTILSGLPLGDLRHSRKITKGKILQEILNAVDSIRPDWIIQGSRTSFGPEEWIAGGIAWRLIQEAACPIITVKHGPSTSRQPLLSERHPLVPFQPSSAAAQSEAPSLRKILFLTGFGESSGRALPHAAALAKKTGAELIILHILPNPYPIVAVRGNHPIDDPTQHLQLLVERARTLQTGLNASTCLRLGNPEEVIFSRIQEGDVDMIVMGTGKEIGAGMIQASRLTNGIFRHAPCPVMTINREGILSGIENRYQKIFRKLTPADLVQISAEQPEAVGENLFRGRTPYRISELFLKYYTHASLNRIFEEYGIFNFIRLKGFADPIIALNLDDPYRQRLRVCFGGMDDEGHTLIEMILSEGTLDASRLKDAPARGHYFPVLMVEWLCMQNPAASFTPEHPPLPGQQHPGLGMSREILQLISLIGMRIGMDGLAIHPMYYHAAVLYHRLFQCYNPVQEGQLYALMRDTEEFNLNDVSWAVELDCLYSKQLNQKASLEVDYQVHPLTALLRQHFHSENYHRLFWESLANHRYQIDWPQFNRRLPERIHPGDAGP
jgi:nucleotide-binding universal stress UspA family protein